MVTSCWILTIVILIVTAITLFNAAKAYGNKDDAKTANLIRISIATGLLIIPLWLVWLLSFKHQNGYSGLFIVLLTYTAIYTIAINETNYESLILMSNPVSNFLKNINKILYIATLISIIALIFHPSGLAISVLIAIPIFTWQIISSFKREKIKRDKNS